MIRTKRMKGSKFGTLENKEKRTNPGGIDADKDIFERKIVIIFFISDPKHMLWVLKRTVSMRRFF